MYIDLSWFLLVNSIMYKIIHCKISQTVLSCTSVVYFYIYCILIFPCLLYSSCQSGICPFLFWFFFSVLASNNIAHWHENSKVNFGFFSPRVCLSRTEVVLHFECFPFWQKTWRWILYFFFPPVFVCLVKKWFCTLNAFLLAIYVPINHLLQSTIVQNWYF